MLKGRRRQLRIDKCCGTQRATMNEGVLTVMQAVSLSMEMLMSWRFRSKDLVLCNLQASSNCWEVNLSPNQDVQQRPARTDDLREPMTLISSCVALTRTSAIWARGAKWEGVKC